MKALVDASHTHCPAPGQTWLISWSFLQSISSNKREGIDRLKESASWENNEEW
jgi:hypothetical protein